MSQITYVQPGGESRTLTAKAGQSVMSVAVENNISGIVGECGGNAMCATCHVYVDPYDSVQLAAPGDEEQDMLECTAAERTASSRLSCQLPAIEDMTVRIPEEQ